MTDVSGYFGDLAVNSIPFRIVMAMPAYWPTYAQTEVRRAIQTAGLLDDRLYGKTKLEFVGESEAATLAAVHHRTPHHYVSVCY